MFDDRLLHMQPLLYMLRNFGLRSVMPICEDIGHYQDYLYQQAEDYAEMWRQKEADNARWVEEYGEN
jgi:hypothetical protein